MTLLFHVNTVYKEIYRVDIDFVKLIVENCAQMHYNLDKIANSSKGYVVYESKEYLDANGKLYAHERNK